MIEKQGNLWTFQGNSDWVCVTTNHNVSALGYAIMGRGIAQEAAQRCPGLPAALGERITREGSQVFMFCTWGIITFPTKEDWWKPSPIKLIENSCKALHNMVDDRKLKGAILMPRPGCGNGKLHWREVKPIVQRYLSSDQYQVFTL